MICIPVSFGGNLAISWDMLWGVLWGGGQLIPEKAFGDRGHRVRRGKSDSYGFVVQQADSLRQVQHPAWKAAESSHNVTM
jgi:hypothetical protein